MDMMRKFDLSRLTSTNLNFLMFLNDHFLTYLSASFQGACIVPVWSINTTHHLHKLIEIYFSVPVIVYLRNCLCQLLASVDIFKIFA